MDNSMSIDAQNLDACPREHKELRNQGYECPYDCCAGKCFDYCDLDSDHTCGECIWWYCLAPESDEHERHKKVGTCLNYFGVVNSDLKTNCPKWKQKSDGWVEYPKWMRQYIRRNKKSDDTDELLRVRLEANRAWKEMCNNY